MDWEVFFFLLIMLGVLVAGILESFTFRDKGK